MALNRRAYKRPDCSDDGVLDKSEQAGHSLMQVSSYAGRERGEREDLVVYNGTL